MRREDPPRGCLLEGDGGLSEQPHVVAPGVHVGDSQSVLLADDDMGEGPCLGVPEERWKAGRRLGLYPQNDALPRLYNIRRSNAVGSSPVLDYLFLAFRAVLLVGVLQRM